MDEFPRKYDWWDDKKNEKENEMAVATECYKLRYLLFYKFEVWKQDVHTLLICVQPKNLALILHTVT